MNYAVLDVDSTSYVDAVGQLAGADRSVVNAIDQLTDVIYGCGAMAGSDTGGAEWARQYDPAAAQLVQAGCTMGDALANMANLLNGSLANHDGAEHGAMMYPGMPAAASGDTDPDHGTMSLSAPAPPSAAGGTGDQPDWWHWIASHVGGLLWPDADTGQLRKAGAAWIAAGTTISNVQYDVHAADSALYAITSPEMDDVHGACADIATRLSDLGAMYVAVGNACKDYAQHVDDKHQEIQNELVSFLEWTVAIEAAGGILSVVTVGISEAAAQAAEGAEIANAASKVIRILNELIELARTVKTAIETAIKSLGELVLKLGKFVNAKLVKALETAGGALARDIPEDLKALEGSGALSEDELKAIDFYTGPGYDALNAHLRGVAADVASGTATRAELEEYSRLVSQGLDRLPGFEGETLRGTNLPQSVLDGIDSTGTFKDPAFMSSSTSEDVAQGFRGNGNAMLHIDGTSGHDIASLSQYKNEAEVLFDKGTPFDVVSKVWNPKGYWDIYLKEPR